MVLRFGLFTQSSVSQSEGWSGGERKKDAMEVDPSMHPPVHSQRRLIVAPAEPAAAIHPVLPSRSMVGLATLTRSIGVRIPGGQPTDVVAAAPWRKIAVAWAAPELASGGHARPVWLLARNFGAEQNGSASWNPPVIKRISAKIRPMRQMSAPAFLARVLNVASRMIAPERFIVP